MMWFKHEEDGPNRWDGASPVRVKDDGSAEWLFMRPTLTHAGLRWAAIRGDLRDDFVVLLAGSAGMVVGAQIQPDVLGWTLLVICPLAIVAALIDTASCLLLPHAEVRLRELGRQPGRFFYRSQHFAAASSADRAVINGLVRTVHTVFAGPAARWIGPEPLRDLHVVAWEAVQQLANVQRLRCLLQDGLDAPGLLQMMAKASREAAATLAELQKCAFLAETWNAQLRQVGTPEAREVTEAAFARLTAARDVYGGGRFPWERN